MNEWLRIARALSDESRVRALLLLRDGELCACHLIALLALAPSTVSAHMAVLQRAGLVEVRKEGRWRHYRLVRPAAAPLRKGLRLLFDALEGDGAVQNDQHRREEVLAGACAR